MATLTSNERSWSITVISEINSYLGNKNLLIKKADGEKTINTGTQRMFPDVMLYGDKQQVLQGWEVKMPDVQITNEEFILDAQRKAHNLNLNSCLIWNFSYGVLYVKNANGDFIKNKSWNRTNFIKTRQDVERFEADWKDLLFDILLELNSLFLDTVLKSASLGDIISNSVMNDIIYRNKSIVSSSLKTTALGNSQMRSCLDVWWNEVKIEYLSDESDCYLAYSKTILLSWLNRFLFANIIKTFHNPAIIVETLDCDSTPEDAIEVFNRITNECDFYNVFKNVDYSHLIPEDTWRDLIEFNGFIKDSNIESVDYSALQNILENTISTSRRAVIGQYTTPQKLARILVRMATNNIEGPSIDPCCGTGTISTESLKNKMNFLSMDNAVESTWAADKNSFPLQIANLNMTSPEAINIPSRIFQANVFDLLEKYSIEIVNPTSGDKMQLELPLFSTVTSNLPFVSSNRERQEKRNVIGNIISTVYNDTGITLSARNDLYTYIIFKLKDILAADGCVGIITSNSWLGTHAGKQFFDALRWYYDVKGIYISGNGKWFMNADVMASIVILSNKKTSPPADDLSTNFGILNKRLHDLSDEDIDKLVNSSILSREIDNSVVSLKTYNQLTISQLLSMNININALFHNVEWLIDIQEKLIDLGELFTVFRGEKTGQDEIFYLDSGCEVDEEYIIMGLKNSRNCNRLIAIPDTNVFSCTKSIDELNDLGHLTTISWLSRFENVLNKSLLLRGDDWYKLYASKLSILFTGMHPHNRIFVGRFNEPTFINQRLIGLIPVNTDINIDLTHALLNSMIGMFYIEAIGFGRGLGALDFSKDNFAEIKILNPDILTELQVTQVLQAFQPILNRDIMKTEDELNDTDRILFEQTVLRVFGIEEYFDNIKSSLLSLQNKRLSVHQ